MTMMLQLLYLLLLSAAALGVFGTPLHAQASKGPPNALQGFSQNRDQPVHIEAATLECATRKSRRPSAAT
jgi:lipopolysaccharide export system protein LptA